MDTPKQTTDAVEHQKNLEELRRKLTEAVDFCTTAIEAERRKKECVAPEFQEKEEEIPENSEDE